MLKTFFHAAHGPDEKHPEFRGQRLQELREHFIRAVSGVEESFKYKMPTFEKGDNWVSIANQKHYISVYFCSEELIADIKVKHPKLSFGKGCVRIKDNQDLPLADLGKAFKKAMRYK
ncbi:DUF1801 domain-containing protein [Kaarinaea lacus]